MEMADRNVYVAGSFFVIHSQTIRFLEEAAKQGRFHALLLAEDPEGNLPDDLVKWTMSERQYILENTRYVSAVTIAEDGLGRFELPLRSGVRPDIWAVVEKDDQELRRRFCEMHGIKYRVIKTDDLKVFPPSSPPRQTPGRKKVMVTGCFDWFHSGHVRFFEEASAYGALYVVVGSDRNVRLLKGEGHPLFPQEERRYVVQSVRFVERALVSSGTGWMGAAPEIQCIRPDIYLVNEDGDQPEKREFCKRRGLEYVALKREPKPGLPPRRSTDLRGF